MAEDYANSSQVPEEFGFDRPLRQTVAEHAVQVSFVEDKENAYYSLFFLDDEVSTNGSSSKNPVNPLFDWQCTPGDEGYNFEDHLDDSKPAEEEPTIPSSLLQQPPTWPVPENSVQEVLELEGMHLDDADPPDIGVAFADWMQNDGVRELEL